MVTQELLKDALKYGKCFVRNGNTANYIPELQRVNKYQLGICAVGFDGDLPEVVEVGDSRVPFTIQSISKIISLILAVRDRGPDYLFHDKVGVEPTGDPFNSIVKLETKSRPFKDVYKRQGIQETSHRTGGADPFYELQISDNIS